MPHSRAQWPPTWQSSVLAQQGRVSEVLFLPASQWSLTPERILFAFEAEQIAPNGMCFPSDSPRRRARPQTHPSY